MMTSHSFTTSVALAIEAAAPDIPGVSEVWLFGSALISAAPRDIDLLVVYVPDVISPTQAMSLRAPLRRAIARVSSLKVHLVLLSEGEALETGFADAEGAVRVFPPFDPAG
jgi:predicted nucleotidyltransferase